MCYNSLISSSDDPVELTDGHSDRNYLCPCSVKLEVKVFHYGHR